MCDYPTLARIADALERIAVMHEAEEKAKYAERQTAHIAVVERHTVALERIFDHLTRDAQPAAPDMSAALEAEYQRGRADGALTERRDVAAYLFGQKLYGEWEDIKDARHLGAAVATDARNYGGEA